MNQNPNEIHLPLDHENLHKDLDRCEITPHNLSLGEIEGKKCSLFNGTDSSITIKGHAIDANSDFSLSAWIWTDPLTDVVGDILSSFDDNAMKGFHLGVLTNGGVTSTSTTNHRMLQFGIDDAKSDGQWTDCGRPGNATLGKSLVTHKGHLYFGAMDHKKGGTGELYRYQGGDVWEQVGTNPVACNCISGLVSFNGDLYASVGRYIVHGSQLGEQHNNTPGGQVYRIHDNGEWEYCGHPALEGAVSEDTPTPGYFTDKADETHAMCVYQGKLYAVSNHRKGVHRYEGEQNWVNIGPDSRFFSLMVHGDKLLALSNGDAIYAYGSEGTWELTHRLEKVTQVYSGAHFKNELYIGTWPECEVWKIDQADQAQNMGRVGYGREVMGMCNYNGKLYVSELPMANVYRMDQDGFKFTGNLDDSQAMLRRVWAMGIYEGEMYATTLPSGRIKKFASGRLCSHHEFFPGGWHHVGASREGSHLNLYLDGQLVSRSKSFHTASYRLDNDLPLVLGQGTHKAFTGAMRDLRIANQVFSASQWAALATP